MYDIPLIGIVISRSFSLNIEYNFHKFEILFDSKFSLESYNSSDAVQQTYKLIDYSNSKNTTNNFCLVLEAQFTGLSKL